MKFERFDTGEPKRTTDRQTQQHSRKRIAQRRIRSLVIWLLVLIAVVVFFISGGKELIFRTAQTEWKATESTRKGGKAAGELFQRGSVKEAESEFEENR